MSSKAKHVLIQLLVVVPRRAARAKYQPIAGEFYFPAQFDDLIDRRNAVARFNLGNSTLRNAENLCEIFAG